MKRQDLNMLQLLVEHQQQMVILKFIHLQAQEHFLFLVQVMQQVIIK